MTGRRRTATKKVTPETGISGNFKDEEYKDNIGYDGPPPPRGLYPGKLNSVGQHTTTEDSIVWTFDIADGKYAGWRGWTYSNMSTMKWRTHEILVSLGIIEPNAEIDITFDEIMKKAGLCRLRIVEEEYGDDTVPKIGKIVKAGQTVESVPDPEVEDEEDEDFKKEEKPARSRRGAQKDPEPEDEPEDDERAERAEELCALALTALKKEAKEAGLALADYRGKKAPEIVKLILAAEFDDADEDEEDEEKGDGDELDLDALEEELEDMSLADLKKKAKEFGVTRAEMKDLDEDELVDLILEKAEEQNPPF